jgi:hypothetical protein
MPASPLSQKLQVKPGYKLLALHAPKSYFDDLQPLPEGVQLAHTAKGHFDVVHLFVTSGVDFRKRIGAASKSVKPGGILWVSWPKASKLDTDLNRDTLAAEAAKSGLRTVASVSVDETWAALRFKPA